MIKTKFLMKKNLFYYITMFLFSFSIIALEMIYFHVLLNITNYLSATFIISIAMLGIAIGSFVGFYFSKFKTNVVLPIAAVLFLGSIVLSYFNIINIGTLQYPYLLVLPFVFGTVIISLIFAHTHSNKIYFINLLGSATGVLFPVIFVPLFKSESSLILLLLIPVIFFFLVSFRIKSLIVNLIFKAVSITLFSIIFVFFMKNISIPQKIEVETYKTEIAPKLVVRSRATNGIYYVNRQLTEFGQNMFSAVYKLHSTNNYYERIEEAHSYDKKAVKYLFNQIGFLDDIDFNFDIELDQAMNYQYKVFSVTKDKSGYQRLILSEDDLLGKVDITGNGGTMAMAINSVYLDSIDRWNGAILDPRVPWMDNAHVFIVGLSADGIVKSAKRLPNSKVSGIEINPTIRRIMTGDDRFAKFAHQPYENVEVFKGEGRSLLESRTNKYDMITLMNIHMEHGPVSTLSPEFFHTIEATELMFNKLTERGLIVYEEIVVGDRSLFAYYKLINTISKTLRDRGIANSKDCMMAFSWDFWGGKAFRTLFVKQTPFTQKEIRYYSRYVNAVIATGKKYSYPKWELAPHRRTGSMIEKLAMAETPIYAMTNYQRTIDMNVFVDKILKKTHSKKDRKTLLKLYKYRSGGVYVRKSYLTDKNKKALRRIFTKVNFPWEIDIAPTTDNKPFPFNVYKTKREVSELLTFILIAALLLFIPIIILVFVKHKKFKHKVILPMVYFALLGFGFMLVEIVLMQYFQRYIGNPTYALIVTLGGILLFSGLGSFFSRNFSKKQLIISLSLIPVILLLQMLFLDNIFSLFASLRFGGKIVLSAVLLFPITFLMGIPFPHILEHIKKQVSAEYGTLMYGVSGAFSTIAATSSIMISVTSGFMLTFGIGIAAYVAAIPMFLIIKRSK